MEDEWQQAAFSSRHMHNRNAGNNKTSGGMRGGKNKGAFDVRQMFGTFTLECPKATGKSKTQSRSAKKARKDSSKRDSGSSSEDVGVLEIYRMTDDGRGLIGSLLLPVDHGGFDAVARATGHGGLLSGVCEDDTRHTQELLEATVILAGSRKVMRQLVNDISHGEQGEEVEDDHVEADASLNDQERGRNAQNNEGDYHQEIPEEREDDDEEEEQEQEEDADEDRYQKPFEKNSFRSPKFWMEWQVRTNQAESERSHTLRSGTAYLVFQGKDCRKYSGTMSCPSADWDNLPVSGHKVASSTPRDTAAPWLV